MMRRTSRGTGLRALLVVGMALLVSSCATQTVGARSGSAVAGTSPLQSVERFLAAVQARDLDRMAGLFGTSDGPVEWERVEVELHMDLLASVLAHQDYEIVSEGMVPGRPNPTTRVGVTMTMGDRVIPDVSYLTVRTEEGRWMVQEIDLERITSGR